MWPPSGRDAGPPLPRHKRRSRAGVRQGGAARLADGVENAIHELDGIASGKLVVAVREMAGVKADRVAPR